MNNQVELGEGEGGLVRAQIRVLDRTLATLPTSADEWEARANTARELIRALEENSVDGETLLRHGMPSRASLPLFIGLIEGTTIGLANADEWRRVLGVRSLRDDASDEDSFAELSQAIHRIDAWTKFAPLDDVLTLTPPTPEELSSYVLGSDARQVLSLPYIWLWLRSVRDDVRTWPTATLHLEYRWRSDIEAPPFAAEALEYEGPALEILNDEIAFRAATSDEEQSEAESSIFWQLQDTAVNFLEKDRHTEAAALFEFYCRNHPDDPRGYNNLGFCIIPTEPSRALGMLKRAESAKYDSLLVNVYNQLCCLIALNRLDEALDRAEFFWQREYDVDEPRGAFVWRSANESWEFFYEPNVPLALTKLAGSISASIHREDRVKRWQEREVEQLAALTSEVAVVDTTDSV